MYNTAQQMEALKYSYMKKNHRQIQISKLFKCFFQCSLSCFVRNTYYFLNYTYMYIYIYIYDSEVYELVTLLVA